MTPDDNSSQLRLLAADEVPPVLEENDGGRSPYLLICDHYGRVCPRALGDLGVSEAEWERHIAWDIGIAGVAHRLCAALDAHLIAQRYSRLVIDCNRPLDAPSSIPLISEATTIPGNDGLTQEERAVRAEAIFAPYHRRIAMALDARARDNRPTILIALPSMPALRGPGTSARCIIVTRVFRRSCANCYSRRTSSSSATTSPMRSAMRPITAFPFMARRAACRIPASRSGRI
jgi:predicted N-formylglutamate amidohydrolase